MSNSIKEVFEEDEPSDPGAQLILCKEKVENLNKLVEEQKKEIQRMKERNGEILEEKQVNFLYMKIVYKLDQDYEY